MQPTFCLRMQAKISVNRRMSEREPSLLGGLAVSEKEESEAKPSEIPILPSATHQIFRVPYMAKVHKSVGNGAVRECNDKFA